MKWVCNPFKEYLETRTIEPRHLKKETLSCYRFDTGLSADNPLIFPLIFIGSVQEIYCRDAESDKDKEDDNRGAEATL